MCSSHTSHRIEQCIDWLREESRERELSYETLEMRTSRGEEKKNRLAFGTKNDGERGRMAEILRSRQPSRNRRTHAENAGNFDRRSSTREREKRRRRIICLPCSAPRSFFLVRSVLAVLANRSCHKVMASLCVSLSLRKHRTTPVQFSLSLSRLLSASENDECTERRTSLAERSHN